MEWKEKDWHVTGHVSFIWGSKLVVEMGRNMYQLSKEGVRPL